MFNRIVFLNFKIGLSLFGCAEKYTAQSTHCAVQSSVVQYSPVYWTVVDSTGLYWAVLEFNGLNWAVLGFSGL